MPVLDASVLVAYLTGGEFALEARGALLADPRRNWAPHLVDAEVGHALRRIVHAGECSDRAARVALDDLADFPVRRAGHRGLSRWQSAWTFGSSPSIVGSRRRWASEPASTCLAEASAGAKHRGGYPFAPGRATTRPADWAASARRSS